MAEFKILRTWEIETNINCLLHSSSSEYYSKLNILFMIPIIILSSSTGTLGLMNTNSSQIIVSNNLNVMSLLVGIFGLLSAMLTTIHNFLGIQKLQSTHNFHSTEYNKISREIKMHIYLSETDHEYIKQCRAKIDNLIETAPEIPNHIEDNPKLQHKIKSIRNDENNELNEIITLSSSRDTELKDASKENVDISMKTLLHSEPIAMIHATPSTVDKKAHLSEVILKSHEQQEGVSVKIIINDRTNYEQENESDDALDVSKKISPSSSGNRSSFDGPSVLARDNSLKKIKYYFSSIDSDEN